MCHVGCSTNSPEVCIGWLVVNANATTFAAAASKLVKVATKGAPSRPRVDVRYAKLSKWQGIICAWRLAQDAARRECCSRFNIRPPKPAFVENGKLKHAVQERWCQHTKYACGNVRARLFRPAARECMLAARWLEETAAVPTP